MSFRTISEVVELAVSEASLFEKIGQEASQGDWIDTGMDAVQLGIDVARRLLPSHELNKPLDVPSAGVMANDLVERLTHSLQTAVEANGGKHLTLADVLKALESIRHYPHLLKVAGGTGQ